MEDKEKMYYFHVMNIIVVIFKSKFCRIVYLSLQLGFRLKRNFCFNSSGN